MKSVRVDPGTECLADFVPDAHQISQILESVRSSRTGHVRAVERFSLLRALIFGGRARRVIEAYRAGSGDSAAERVPFPERASTDWDEYYSRPYRTA